MVWDISYKCNYDCSYCTSHAPFTNGSQARITPGKMQEISREMYQNYSSGHIRFSGGEPFIYPDFIDILAVLAEYHTFEVSTNLSIDVNKIKDKLDPEVLLLSTSFHPEFADQKEFLKKVLFLKENRFKISVTMVAFPPFLEQIKEYKAVMEKNGVQFVIQLFNGLFRGQVYPEAYTPEEKAMLKQEAENSLQKDANKQIFEARTCREKTPDKLCRMGQAYAKIGVDGNIFRCCSPDCKQMGNIFIDGLRLLDQAQPCEIKNCPCWKAMLVGKEDSWLTLWEYPIHKKHSG